MIWLLRLYPRAWQRRYRDEVAAHLASEPRTFRLLLDLIAGAIDARLNPQWTPQTSPTGGEKMMPAILRSCRSSRYAPANPLLNAALMIGVTLVATGPARAILLAAMVAGMYVFFVGVVFLAEWL